MKHFRRLSAPLAMAAIVLSATTNPDSRSIERTVAVTFDDLPATSAGAVAADTASLEDLTRTLLTAVRQHEVPAIGFVNEGRLFVEGAPAGDVQRRIGLLRMWLDAGAVTPGSTRHPRPGSRHADAVVSGCRPRSQVDILNQLDKIHSDVKLPVPHRRLVR